MNAPAEQPATPAWITSLPGFDSAKDYNYLSIAGAEWHHFGNHNLLHQVGHHIKDAATGETTRLLYVHQIRSGSYAWRSNLVTPQGDRIVDASGTAETPEAAARTALDFDHTAREFANRRWHRGEIGGRLVLTTRIDGKPASVEETYNRTWSWSRHVDLGAFRTIGLRFDFDSDYLGGECDNPEDAMQAALDAPALVRAACREYLNDSRPRSAPDIIDFTIDAAVAESA